MTAQSTDLEDNGLVLPEEDGLFARDIDGQLVRMDKVTAADFEKQITIKIDGREVTVPKAVPQTDSQGKPPRFTTPPPRPMRVIPRGTRSRFSAIRSISIRSASAASAVWRSPR